MPLYHDEDQAMLADTAAQFMAEEGAIAKQLRHWRDRDCKDGFGHELWKQFAEMGFTGILVNEDDGGMGMGNVEAGIVLEQIGRNLTPSPFLTSSVLAATALKDGSDDLRGAICRACCQVTASLQWRSTRAQSTALKGSRQRRKNRVTVSSFRARRTLSFTARAQT